ncbi:MAG: hypothetical protein QE272_06475, partial [Nevskia sp.]|nr:hypothetical protein [Nevskia sp.]
MLTFLKSLRLTSKLAVMIAMTAGLVGLATWLYIGQINLALGAVRAEQGGIAPALAAFGTGAAEDSASARAEWRESMVRIADESTLSLDPEASTYHLMSAALFDAPRLIAALGDARRGGTTASDAATLHERTESAYKSMSASTHKSFA